MNSFAADLGPRRHDLDWVRIGAFMLLIFYHVGMYYVTWDFHVKSPHASSALEPLMMLTSPWRLSLLFLVSGVATAYLWARDGGNFMRARSIRLLIPLAFGMLVIVPPQSYLEVAEERCLAGAGVLIWPIALLAVACIGLVARFPQNHALIGDWYSHASYFTVFVLGFALAGTKAPWQALQRLRWHTLGAAILGWSSLCAYYGIYSAETAMPPEALRLFMRGVYGAEQWLGSAAVLGFAHRHLIRDTAARRYLTAAIFPVYILHQTVIIVLAHALRPANLAPPVEAMLLIMTTAAACFMAYELIRRIGILRPLFGVGGEANVESGSREEDSLRAPAET